MNQPINPKIAMQAYRRLALLVAEHPEVSLDQAGGLMLDAVAYLQFGRAVCLRFVDGRAELIPDQP